MPFLVEQLGGSFYVYCGHVDGRRGVLDTTQNLSVEGAMLDDRTRPGAMLVVLKQPTVAAAIGARRDG